MKSSISLIQAGGYSFLAVAFSGRYDRSSGAALVQQMEEIVTRAFRDHLVSGLVIDFSDFDYVWGDDLMRPLDFHPDIPPLDDPAYPATDFFTLRPFSVVYVISNLNREGLTSLIEREFFDVAPGDVLFESLEEAVHRLVSLCISSEQSNSDPRQ